MWSERFVDPRLCEQMLAPVRPHDPPTMGIADRWILMPGNSASEIGLAFAVCSRSTVRTSLGAQTVRLGGFSN
jgi:hypothetical protein